MAALLTGGAIAAVAATGQGHGHHHAHAHRVALAQGHSAGPLIAAAAAYLGISPEQLGQQLRGGRTLAQIAAATPGKSEAGLLAAVEAAGRARLQKDSAQLPQRAANLVKRPILGVRHHRGARAVILSYLGISASTLSADLHSGKSLAQVADATSGKSAQGLIAALVAARQTHLDAAVKAGRMAPAQEAKRLAGLTKRVTAVVEHTHTGRSH